MIDEIIQKGLISVHDAHDLLERAVFLDCTFVLPTSDDNVHDNFHQGHIDTARFFDIEAVCDKTSDLPHMLPSQEIFERAMRELGLKHDDLLILYGQHGMIMGPARVWWMMRGFGHHRVAVLDGGLPAWVDAGFKIETGAANDIAPSDYSSAEFDMSHVLSMDEMIAISESAACPVLDARPAPRFHGDAPEPRADMRSGHIPNSSNLPCSTLIDEHGCFKSKEELEALFADHDRSKRIIATCGSGITACALALALYHIGCPHVAVYDGSWSEWGRVESGTRVGT